MKHFFLLFTFNIHGFNSMFKFEKREMNDILPIFFSFASGISCSEDKRIFSSSVLLWKGESFFLLNRYDFWVLL